MKRYSFSITLCSVLLFFTILSTLTLGSRHFGLTWDEGIYFQFADSIQNWIRVGVPLDEHSLHQFWAYDVYANPHPAFMKIISSLFEIPSHNLIPYPESYRFGHFLYFSAGIATVFFLLSEVFGILRSALAVFLILIQPRFFGELLVATTDAPVAIDWILICLFGWKIARTKDAGGPSPLGCWVALVLLCGAATATKFTGFLAIIPLIGLFLFRKDWRNFGLALLLVPSSLAFLALCSPENWHTPWIGVWDYLTYPMRRGDIIKVATYYMGEIFLNSPPWHYFPLMLLVTTPLSILILLIGLPLIRKDSKEYALFKAMAPFLGIWIVFGFSPATPKHDGLRQFASFLPFVGIVAWLGLTSFWDRFVIGCRPALKHILLSSLLLLGASGLLNLAQSHPFEFSYYNELIGGIPGAEKKGFELTYYLEVVNEEVLQWINRTAKPGEVLRMLPDYPPYLESYQNHGLLRKDIRVSNFGTVKSGDLMILVRRRHIVNDQRYASAVPLYERSYDGVSLVKVLRLP